jgi:hypothetical protein
MTDQNQHSIANFAALKTAIVNGEEELIKALLSKKPMQELEKSYLLDLAKLNENCVITKLINNIPEQK